MNKEYEFIKQCGVFYVLTLNHDFPAGRPFGAIMEQDGALYISTADTKEVYKQLKENENMQIVALKPGTREWIRVSGKAIECTELETKRNMLEQCPVLTRHYASAEEAHFNIFRIDIVKSEFYC